MSCNVCGGNYQIAESQLTPIALMCDPNNLLGGGGTTGLDYEVLGLANPDDLTQSVTVVHDFNPTTGVYTPVYRNVDGTTYTGTTPPVNPDFESLTGCDATQHNVVWDTIAEGVLGTAFNFLVVDNLASTDNIVSSRGFLTSQIGVIYEIIDVPAAPLAYSFDTSTLEDGLYDIHVEVTYGSGDTFIDQTHLIRVNNGVPAVITTFLVPGAHIIGGTRTFHVAIEEVAQLFDASGALLGTYQLPLTATPVPYALTGNDFLLVCPDPIVEEPNFVPLGRTQFYTVCECWIDDTLNNGAAIVPFTRVKVINLDNGELFATYDKTPDLTANYNPVGVERLCEDTGTATTLRPRRMHFTGAASFTLPLIAQSVTVKVRSVGNVGTPPMLDDGNTVTPLFAGDVETWGAQDGRHFFLAGAWTVTSTHINDSFTVLWTEVS